MNSNSKKIIYPKVNMILGSNSIKCRKLDNNSNNKNNNNNNNK